jgi:hypothetical protein
METLADGLLGMMRVSIAPPPPPPPPRSPPPPPPLIILLPSVFELLLIVALDVVVVVVVPAEDIFATADINAASPPCESTMVVIQEFSGSGGNRTRVIIPGTTSEKCLETKVEIRDDLPTPSVLFIIIVSCIFFFFLIISTHIHTYKSIEFRKRKSVS